MKPNQIAIISSSLGIGLVMLSLCLTYLILPALPASVTWTGEQEKALADASMTFHKQSFSKVSEEELAATEAEFETHQAEFDRSNRRRNSLPKYANLCGVTLVLVGIAAYIFGKARDED